MHARVNTYTQIQAQKYTAKTIQIKTTEKKRLNGKSTTQESQMHWHVNTYTQIQTHRHAHRQTHALKHAQANTHTRQGERKGEGATHEQFGSYRKRPPVNKSKLKKQTKRSKTTLGYRHAHIHKRTTQS